MNPKNQISRKRAIILESDDTRGFTAHAVTPAGAFTLRPVGGVFRFLIINNKKILTVLTAEKPTQVNFFLNLYRE